jgi:hypothetical protein
MVHRKTVLILWGSLGLPEWVATALFTDLPIQAILEDLSEPFALILFLALFTKMELLK